MDGEIEDFLLSFHKTDLLQILENDDTSKHFSLNINFILLYEHKPDSVVKLLNEPEKCLVEWDKAALRSQMVLLKDADMKCQLKNNVHCRIFHLPYWPAVRRTTFPGNRDVGKFFQLSGTVMRVTSPKLLEFQRSYICVKCKTPVEVTAEYDRKYMITQPTECENDCGGKNFVNFGGLDSENCRDYQEIKIQEQVKQLGMGSMPDVMLVTLEDDLVDFCKPGDNVTICGVLKRRWGEFVKGKLIEIDLSFKANHVQVDNSSASMTVSTPEVRQMFGDFWEKYKGNPLEGRDVILKSFCTQLYGLYLVKLAMAVVLAGGGQSAPAPATGESTSAAFRTRSESHLLLVGDPGTGKSQLLRFATKIIPRSVLTTGVGSTAAGLTVTATMEQGEWHLEGGALVMADGGICCIDEFNSMKEHDRTTIHEAMEQQTISVAKAGIVAKLNTRCSILAACNPKGNIDPSQSVAMNVALPSPLLSRFDLILMLRDVVDDEWNERVADYILNGGHEFSKLTDSGLWTVDVLQSYFVTIKKLDPKLTEDAETILGAYYQMQRGIDSRNKARTTVRLLESLVRLSRGHARLMFHEKIEVVDSIYAIILSDIAMDRDSAILNLNITMNSVFPERPMVDYKTMLEAILTRLQLTEILERELKAIPKINYGTVQSRFFHGKPNSENIDPIVVPEKHQQIESNEFANLSITDNMPHNSNEVLNITKTSIPDEGYDTASISVISSNSKPVTSGLKTKSNSKINHSDSSNLYLNDDLNEENSRNLEVHMRSSQNRSQSDAFNSRLKETDKNTPLDISRTSQDFLEGRKTTKKLNLKGKGGKTKNTEKIQKQSKPNIFDTDIDDGCDEEDSFIGLNQIDQSHKNKSDSGITRKKSEFIGAETNGAVKENTVDISEPSQDRLKNTKKDHFGSKSPLEDDVASKSTNTKTSHEISAKPGPSGVKSNIRKQQSKMNSFDVDIDFGCDEMNLLNFDMDNSFSGKDHNQKSHSVSVDPELPKKKLKLDDIGSIVSEKKRPRNDKLKKFEFVRRHKSVDPPEQNQVACTSDFLENKEKSEKGSRTDSADFIQSDLQMLKYMPGINDDFGIDLDFDWDNFDGKAMEKKSDQLSTSHSTGSFEKNQRLSQTSNMFESEDNLETADLEI